MRLDDLLDLLAERRGITRQQGPGTADRDARRGELLSGAVAVDRSELVAELLGEDPG